MSCIPISEFSAYLGRDFSTTCNLNSFIILPEDFTMKRMPEKMIKKIIITDYIESVSGLKSVCPIYVKSRRLSRNNASHADTRMHKNNLKKGLFYWPKGSRGVSF